MYYLKKCVFSTKISFLLTIICLQKLYRQFETIALRKSIISPPKAGETKQEETLKSPKTNPNTKGSSATITSASSSRGREKRKLPAAMADYVTDLQTKKRRSRSNTSEQDDISSYVNKLLLFKVFFSVVL